MNKDIINTIKHYFSEAGWLQIDQNKHLNSFFYYSNFPIRRLAIDNTKNFITYVITYYQYQEKNTNSFMNQKQVIIDYYHNSYKTHNTNEMKSEEKYLIEQILNDKRLQGIMQKEAEYILSQNILKKKLGLD